MSEDPQRLLPPYPRRAWVTNFPQTAFLNKSKRYDDNK